MAADNSKIVVLDYGMGNIHSIVKALRLYSDSVEFTADPAAIDDCHALVLPGDGAFQAAMDHLNGGPKDHLQRFVASGRMLLGICIGFQILFEDSTEVHGEDGRIIKGTVPGLGWLPGNIVRFSGADLRIPHMGWNTLEVRQPVDGLENGQWTYFIHSYHAANVPAEFVVAETTYGDIRFPSIVRKDNIIATQFHPEKSDRAGLRFLEQWVRSCQSGKNL